MKVGEIEVGTPVVTRARQQVALTDARKEVNLFLEAWEGEDLPVVVAAVHVRSALHSLQELVGRIDVEMILGAVFERFCVGK
jgi:tRNA modification GTPase